MALKRYLARFFSLNKVIIKSLIDYFTFFNIFIMTKSLFTFKISRYRLLTFVINALMESKKEEKKEGKKKRNLTPFTDIR